MPMVPVPETYQIRMQFTQAEQQIENVFHVRRTGEANAPEMSQIGGTFASWWNDIMAPNVSNAVTLNQVVVTDIAVPNGVSVLATQGLPTTGEVNTPALPNNVTLAVKWGTGFGGRSFRGRTYHIGLYQGQVGANNRVTPATREAIRAAYDGLRTALDNALLAVEFVVVSRYSGKLPNGQPAPREVGITTPISGVSVNDVVDSQRRRLPGRGS